MEPVRWNNLDPKVAADASSPYYGPRVRHRMRTGQRCILHCAPGYERNLEYPGTQDPATGEWRRSNYTRVPTMQAHCAADGRVYVERVGLYSSSSTPTDGFTSESVP
jgi:hypothetical protein